MRLRHLMIAAFLCGVACAAEPPLVSQPFPGVTVLAADRGQRGDNSMGVAHQNSPNYVVKKILDASVLPEDLLGKVREVRIRIHFGIQDYSWNTAGLKWDGLDEEFELVVNGRSFRYATADGFAARSKAADPLRFEWTDFVIPKGVLKHGANEIILRKCDTGTGNDDYIYPGIDNSSRFGSSFLSMDGGKTWETERLNAIDAQGEYMIRLVLIEHAATAEAVWLPVSDQMEDPQSLVGYAGSDDCTIADEYVRLVGAGRIVLELDASRVSRRRAFAVRVRCGGPAPRVLVTDDMDGEVELPLEGADGVFEAQIKHVVNRPARILIRPREAAEHRVSQISLRYAPSYAPCDPVVNMAPPAAPPKGAANPGAMPVCQLLPNEVILENAALRMRLDTSDGLRVLEIFSAYLKQDVQAVAGASRLFLVEIDGERYGADDFTVTRRRLASRTAVVLDLLLKRAGLAARLVADADADDEVRLELDLSNRSTQPLQFKLAFPHLGGLSLSKTGEGDCYMFPYFGGVVAGLPTDLRTAYGENSAWWQMVDAFSPGGGAGVYIRSMDESGLYKCPALRMGRSAPAGYTMSHAGAYMDKDMLWEQSLAPVDGISMTLEYLRRKREPGEHFLPPCAAIGVHPGDWKVAMQRYAEWAHRAWQWRPTPNALTNRWNITAPGWGQSPLYKDGAYRTDCIEPKSDVLELMSWWEWSDLGPWRVKMDHETIKAELGEALYNRYRAYWVNDPATGKLRYPLNRGDYDGYNEAWGGLSALRDHIESIRKAGMLPTFYVEGILACDSTKVGHKYGPTYGVMNPLWKDGYKCPANPPGYVASYGSWNMCSDTEWWPDYLAATVKRVCRETGIDGVRLDEYGHHGWPCHSDKHEHVFAEPGHNAWLQAVARSCRLVHEAMDEVRPGLVLMTEFPGTDLVASNLEAALTYESASHVFKLRPIPCNIFRFYFPHCKCYELLYGHHRKSGVNWRFWNAQGAFSLPHPPAYHRILKENADAFEGGQWEPLAESPTERIYVNRFGAGCKEIFMVLNGRDFTFRGPILQPKLEPDERLFDLLNCREVKLARGLAMGKLEPNAVACLARLPRRITVVEDAGKRVLKLSNDSNQSALLVVEDSKGVRHWQKAVPTGEATFDLPRVVSSDAKLVVKLLNADGMLVDAIAYERPDGD